MNYGKAMLELVNQRYDARENVLKYIENLNAQNNAGELSPAIYQKNSDELNARLQQIESETSQAILEMQKQHNAAVEKWNQLDASKLTPDAAFFLQDLPMSDSQIEGLVTKHRNNPYMIGVMKAYSERHPHAPVYGLLPGAEQRIEAYDKFVGSAYRASRDGTYLELMQHYPLNAAVDIDYAE